MSRTRRGVTMRRGTVEEADLGGAALANETARAKPTTTTRSIGFHAVPDRPRSSRQGACTVDHSTRLLAQGPSESEESNHDR